MRLCKPATFFIITVWRRSGFRYRSDAIRQIFILPIPCSTTIRFRDTRRFPFLSRALRSPFRGFFFGVLRGVPWYAVSPYPVASLGIRVLDWS